MVAFPAGRTKPVSRLPDEPIELVGREQELAVLLACLEATERGRGALALLGGEPGVGKTRLVLELADRARAGSWRVLSGRGREAAGAPPYLPIVEALREHVRTCAPDVLIAQLGDGGADVALLLPDLRRLLGAGGAAPGYAEEERYRLLDSAAEFVLAIARSEARGLLLVLDDLHWADRATLLFLEYLAGKLAHVPLLVVGIYRTVDRGRADGLDDLLAELGRARLATTVAVGALGPVETASLVRSLAGAAVAPAVAAAIGRQTGGNPFFVEEVVRQRLAEGRDLSDPRTGDGQWSVPEGVRAVLAARLARLSPAAKDALRAGAVLGDGFVVAEMVAMLTDTDDDRLIDALDEAVGAGLLREQGDGYHFAHDLVREAIYRSVGTPRRERLHLRAAEALERAYARDLGPRLSALAVHYRMAGAAADPDTAIDRSEGAGEAALRVFAYEEAAAHWEAALDLMERHGREPEVRARQLVRLAELMDLLGWHEYGRRISYLERALALHEEMGDLARAAELHADLGRMLSSGSSPPTRDLARARAHFRAAEDLLGRGPERVAQARLYEAVSHGAVWLAHADEGLVAARRALRIAERFGAEDTWVRAAMTAGWHAAAGGQLAEGLALLERSWERAEMERLTLVAFGAAFWRSNWDFFRTDPRAAHEWRRREAARPEHAPVRRRAALSGMASACVEMGDLGEAARLAMDANQRDLFVVMYPAPLIAFRRGDWGHAEALWSAALEGHRRTGSRWSQADFAVWLARLHRARGQDGPAEELLREALAIALDGGARVIELWARPDLAAVCARTGRLPEAREHLARCREIMGAREDWRGLAGRVALAEGAVAAAAGDLGTAERRCEDALVTARRVGLPWDEAEALCARGRVLAAAGRRRRADESFDEARALYRRHGAGEHWLERADALQAGAAEQGAAPAGPDELTRREQEVLRLVAAGKSNREIAAELVLSVRTVERHIANIYQKIGAQGKAGRAIATAYLLTQRPT